MAYLGIRNSEKINGVYHFSSLAMAEDIRAQINGCSFYLDKDKAKAMRDFNIEECEIKDGRILMNLYRNSENDMAYLALMDTPFDGVYCFKKKSVRDKEASKFPNIYMSMDKDEMLKKFHISEGEIRDGGFLMSGEVKNYHKSQKTKPVEHTTKDVDAPFGGAYRPFERDIFRQMMNAVSNNHDVAEITMVTGDKYRVTLRKMFFMEKDCDFSKCGLVSGDGNISVNEGIINDMIKDKKIISLDKTTYECNGGFVVLRNCDDEYSPDMHRDENGKANMNHHFSDIIINVNQIVSVVGQNGYPEINLSHISPDKNKLIHNYLSKNF